MCFVFIWEQRATCATYSINWLVFITQMKSVYSAVRTGSLNKAVCASYLKGLNSCPPLPIIFSAEETKVQCRPWTTMFQGTSNGLRAVIRQFFFITVFVSSRCRRVIVGTCREFPHAAPSARTDDLADAQGAVRSTRTATEKPLSSC